MKPVAIQGLGMMTGVGLNHRSSCAAIRAAVTGFADTRFTDGAQWILGSQVPLAEPWRGRAKLARMAAGAVEECLASAPGLSPRDVAFLLCVSEPERPGRFEGIDEHLLPEIQSHLGIRFGPQSRLYPRGRVGAGLAMLKASELLHGGQATACLIVGVDTFLTAATLKAYEKSFRLLTSKNSNGFIPGEAAVAVLVGTDGAPGGGLECIGIGRGIEEATIDSDRPLRADGLSKACREALADSGVTYEAMDYRMSDCNGEQYWFREAALAMTRTLRVRKPEFTIQHPADCIGETGAAAGAAVLAVAHMAARLGYAPGPGVLCQLGSDSGDRIAMVLRPRLEARR